MTTVKWPLRCLANMEQLSSIVMKEVDTLKPMTDLYP